MGHTSLTTALAALDRGGVVAFPTETVFGLGGRLDRPRAIARIFELKGRRPDQPLQVLLRAPDAIGTVAELVNGAAALADAFMPGPITIVLLALDPLPELGGDGITIGVRVPAHPVAAELIAGAGPLAATSANRSGRSTPDDVDGVRAVFGDAVDVYLAGDAPGGTASTVVSLVGEPRLLREGAIGRARIEAVLGRRCAT